MTTIPSRSRIVAVFALFVAAGCATSGPSHNTDVIKLPDGTQAHRVQCQGLFENANTCVNRAKEVCKDQTVATIASVDRVADGFVPKNDPREITFVCGQRPPPVAQQRKE
jgi:hypothetical protein